MTEENTPTLITERLILRRFTDHDAEALFRILSDREVWHRGLITEAGKAVIERLKRSELPYITATHDIHNPRSGGSDEKAGHDVSIYL